MPLRSLQIPHVVTWEKPKPLLWYCR